MSNTSNNSNKTNNPPKNGYSVESIVKVIYISIIVFAIYIAFTKGFFKILAMRSRAYMPTVFATFYQFIRENKVLTLVIGFLISGEVRSMNSSFVDNIIMPLLAPLIPADKWDKSTKISIFEFGLGRLAADFIKFSVTLFIIFILSRIVLFLNTVV